MRISDDILFLTNAATFPCREPFFASDVRLGVSHMLKQCDSVLSLNVRCLVNYLLILLPCVQPQPGNAHIQPRYRQCVEAIKAAYS